MLSVLNSSLGLEAVTASENAISPGIMGFSGHNGPFSDIMANVQKGMSHATEMPDASKTIENLPIPPKLIELLKELMPDGNDLPQEATAILEDLKLQFENLVQENSSQGQLKLLENLFEKVSGAIEQIELSTGHMDDHALELIDELKQELANLEQAILEQIDINPKQLQADSKALPSDHPVDKKPDIQSPAIQSENEQTPQNQSNEDENLMAGLSPEKVVDDTVVSDKRPQKAQLASNLPINEKKTDNFFKPNNPANIQATLNQPAMESELELDVDMQVNTKAAELKNVAVNSQLMGANGKNLPPAHSSAWIHSQALTTKMGAESGFAGMQSNGSGTSFAQMMSQASPAPLTQNIHMPQQWGQALGQRIAWMVGNKLQTAQLRITPAHLGPVEIKLSIENNQAQVSFISQHQVVRDAIEQAVPRLREMFEQQNLDLGDVDVSDRKLAEQGNSNDGMPGFSDENGVSDAVDNAHDVDMQEDQQVVQVSSDGLINEYA